MPRQVNSGEIEPSAGLKGTDQPDSAGNQLGAGGNSPGEMVFLQTPNDSLENDERAVLQELSTMDLEGVRAGLAAVAQDFAKLLAMAGIRSGWAT